MDYILTLPYLNPYVNLFSPKKFFHFFAPFLLTFKQQFATMTVVLPWGLRCKLQDSSFIPS